MDFYTAIIIVSFLSLVSLSALVYDDGRFSREIKRRFLLIYLTIFLSGLAEWLSDGLNGASLNLIALHRIIKCSDYVLSPIAALMIILLISKNAKLIKTLKSAAYINAFIHIISIFTKWTFYVDGNNFHGHGRFYFLYIAYTLVLLAIVVYEFANYSKEFRRQNRLSLMAALLPMYAGFFLQEAINTQYRTLIISMVMTSAMLYIHFAEFTSQKHDDNMSITRKLLDTDSMTGAYSRYHYSQIIKELANANPLPSDLVIYSVDINGLKETNDTYGHAAGDEIICGCAKCIKDVLGKYGQIFRVGGDEFIAILHLDSAIAIDLKYKLKETADKWQGETIKKLSLSIGYASAKERPGMDINDLLKVTDRYMYIDKKAFYSAKENEQRQ